MVEHTTSNGQQCPKDGAQFFPLTEMPCFLSFIFLHMKHPAVFRAHRSSDGHRLHAQILLQGSDGLVTCLQPRWWQQNQVSA